MSQALSLESFEDALSSDDASSADYNQGYEDGLTAGTAAAQAEATVLDDAFVQALSDIDFTYTEARQQILQSLAPFFTMVVSKVLPHCVEVGFAGQLADMLVQAATDDASARPTLHLHPDACEAVAARFDNSTLQVALRPDPSLGPHAAWVQHGGTETHLDMDQLLAQISDYLDAVQIPQHRIEAHG